MKTESVFTVSCLLSPRLLPTGCCRLQVAVQDALRVGVLDRPGDDRDEPGGLARRQRAVGAHLLRERLPADELHAEVRLPADRADLVDGDDVRVLEPRGGLGLGAEPGAVRVGGEVRFADHLQRDDAVQALLPGLVDDAHAAAAEFFEQLEVAELARQCGAPPATAHRRSNDGGGGAC